MNITHSVTVVGDLNCNLLNPLLSSSKALNKLCKDFGLENVVCSPTRVTESSTSLIDVSDIDN